ncbi:hypothetical protein [Bacillus marinisedimentorum]|uniref:hypothetical protein n=1 Tax=Bacillus marinisedimentorum TaxID=1821260 RepID=UPI000871F72A|nr:hypothetical protein [Bacillus marinisedimentorum]
MKLSDLIVSALFALLWVLLFYKEDSWRASLSQYAADWVWITAPIAVFTLLVLLARFFKNRFL